MRNLILLFGFHFGKSMVDHQPCFASNLCLTDLRLAVVLKDRIPTLLYCQHVEKNRESMDIPNCVGPRAGTILPCAYVIHLKLGWLPGTVDMRAATYRATALEQHRCFTSAFRVAESTDSISRLVRIGS